MQKPILLPRATVGKPGFNNGRGMHTAGCGTNGAIRFGQSGVELDKGILIGAGSDVEGFCEGSHAELSDAGSLAPRRVLHAAGESVMSPMIRHRRKCPLRSLLLS